MAKVYVLFDEVHYDCIEGGDYTEILGIFVSLSLAKKAAVELPTSKLSSAIDPEDRLPISENTFRYNDTEKCWEAIYYEYCDDMNRFTIKEYELSGISCNYKTYLEEE